MTRVERALRRIAQDLESLERAWCLIGGLAVSARAEPRTTRDDDIRALLREATAADVEQARDAVRLIDERRASRGKALLAELERALSQPDAL
jgi:hypothetical protein